MSPSNPEQFVEYPRSNPNEDIDRLRAAVLAYRQSGTATGIYLGLMVLWGVTAGVSTPETAFLFTMLLLLGLVAFAGFALVASRSAARVLGTSEILAIIVTLILVFVPCGALIILLSQQGRMAKFIKPYGVRIGFLGPSASDVRRVLGE